MGATIIALGFSGSSFSIFSSREFGFGCFRKSLRIQSRSTGIGPSVEDVIEVEEASFVVRLLATPFLVTLEENLGFLIAFCLAFLSSLVSCPVFDPFFIVLIPWNKRSDEENSRFGGCNNV